MEKIPIVISIDVEPDERQIDPQVPKDWLGFEKAFELFAEVRPRLEDATRAPVRFSWFVRMDPQIAHTYEHPNWAMTRYRGLFERLETAGDEIGLHIHALRWDDSSLGWTSDFGNQEWVDHCVRMSFAAFEQSLSRPCRSFRFGDHWMNDATLDLAEKLGARIDLTIEPGLGGFTIPDGYTGSLPDYAGAPHQPYRPSKQDFTKAGAAADQRELWALPVTTWLADQMPLCGNEHLHLQNDVTLNWVKQILRWGLRLRYEGVLDKVDEQVISGWVYSAKHPNEPLNIEISDGEVPLARFTSDGLRSDLLFAGKGNGRHSFCLPTPSSLKDGRRHSIRAKVTSSRFELAQSPKQFCSGTSTVSGDQLYLNTDPWLMGRSLAYLLRRSEKRHLVFPLRSDIAIDRFQGANLIENLEVLRSHPLVKNFVFVTPAEAVERLG